MWAWIGATKKDSAGALFAFFLNKLEGNIHLAVCIVLRFIKVETLGLNAGVS